MDEYLTCAICLELYSTIRVPLVLECGHTFCRGCLSKILSVKGKIECPTDRNHDPRPLLSINRNISLMHIIDHSNNKQADLPCSLHINKRARFVCIMCKVEFCSRCLISHNFHYWLDKKDADGLERYFSSRIHKIKAYSEQLKRNSDQCQEMLNSIIRTEYEVENIVHHRSQAIKNFIEVREADCVAQLKKECHLLKREVIGSIESFSEKYNTMNNCDEHFNAYCKTSVLSGIRFLEKCFNEYCSGYEDCNPNIESSLEEIRHYANS